MALSYQYGSLPWASVLPEIKWSITELPQSNNLLQDQFPVSKWGPSQDVDRSLHHCCSPRPWKGSTYHFAMVQRRKAAPVCLPCSFPIDLNACISFAHPTLSPTQKSSQHKKKLPNRFSSLQHVNSEALVDLTLVREKSDLEIGEPLLHYQTPPHPGIITVSAVFLLFWESVVSTERKDFLCLDVFLSLWQEVRKNIATVATVTPQFQSQSYHCFC